MKQIILDIDGVIAVGYTRLRTYDWSWGKTLYPFDKKAVKVLNEIITETGAEIILSSDWKLHFTIDEMEYIFEWNGVIKTPIAFTIPSQYYADGILEGGRAFEIKQFIEAHNPKVWVAIDDLDLMNTDYSDFFKDNFIHCKRPNTEGIKQSGLKEKIIKKLNG
jgi:hypothetical protein